MTSRSKQPYAIIDKTDDSMLTVIYGINEARRYVRKGNREGFDLGFRMIYGRRISQQAARDGNNAGFDLRCEKVSEKEC